jgi:3-oxoacyl-[acyl-carrier protein] reductase
MSNHLAAFDLTGRVAVLTGAASGIGEASATLLASCGAAVVCADIDADGAKRTADTITDAGGKAIAVSCNVTKRDDVKAAVDAAVAEWGRLDVMANIAGAMIPGIIEDIDDAAIDKGIDLNLKGVIYGTQYAIKAMRAAGNGGSIINISSGAIDLPYEGIGIYAFTKAAVAMLTMTTAKEVGRYGIRVNALAPGSTVTNFTTWRLQRDPDGSINADAMNAFLAQMADGSALGTVGEAMDQAWMILYLASDASKWVTGNIHRVNGGQCMVW